MRNCIECQAIVTVKRKRVCSDQCRIARNRKLDQARKERLLQKGLCRQCRGKAADGSDKCSRCKALHVEAQRSYRRRFKGKRMEQSWNKLRRERTQAHKAAAKAALRIACRRIAEAQNRNEAVNLIHADLVIQYHEL